MLLEARLENYRAIEEYRGRPLIVYATSTRAGLNAMMAGDVVREFIDQIDAISDGDEVDVLINSTGGDALTAWKLMSLLRERFKKVHVLVPLMAFSAATIFALGADEIVMHPHASLGPIDPQILMRDQNGQSRQFAYEDVGAFLAFIAQEVRITEQTHTSAIMERLFAVVDPLNVGAAKRASDLSTSIGERLLSMHMAGAEDKMSVKAIAENLNKSFFAHGDAVSRRRAKELKLKIAPEDKVLEALIWRAYCGLESHMLLRRAFSPMQDFLADPSGRASIQPPAPLPLPPNAPPQIQQAVINQWAQQAAQQAAQLAIQVPFSYLMAVCESNRVASESRGSGTMSASVQITGDIKLNMVEEASGWIGLEMPRSGRSATAGSSPNDNAIPRQSRQKAAERKPRASN